MKSINSTFLIFSATFLKVSTKLISTLILTRMLAPEAYALIGTLSSIFFIVELLSDIGIRSYIIKLEGEINNELIESLWSIKLLRGFILCILTLAIAFPMEKFFQIPDLGIALVLVSPFFIISGFSSLGLFIADKKNRQNITTILETASIVIASVIVILTALLFESKWCMVFSNIYSSIVLTTLSHIYCKQSSYKLNFNKKIYLNVFHWSKYMTTSGFITILLSQIDKLTFAKLLTENELGKYFLAVNLVSIPIVLIGDYSRRIIAPFLSAQKLLHKNNISDLLFRKKFIPVLLVAFSLATGFVHSNLIISTIFDERYAYVSTYFQILLIQPIFSLFSRPFQAALTAIGKVKEVLYSNIVRLVWISSSAWLLYYYYGTLGLVISFGLVELPTSFYLGIKAKHYQLISIKKESFIFLFFIFSLSINYVIDYFLYLIF